MRSLPVITDLTPNRGMPMYNTISGGVTPKAKGVTQDCFEAVKWYRKAAEQGDSDAQSALKNLGGTW